MTDLTTTQRHNLLKLANYLEALPEDYVHFDMRQFAEHRGDCDLPMEDDVMAAKRPKAFLTNCGTVACAAGHGPAAGVRVQPGEFNYLSQYEGATPYGVEWGTYTKRAFGAAPFSPQFTFMFSGEWKARGDNHHYGAAARIRYLLAKGPPDRDGDDFYSTRRYAPYRKGSRSAARREIDSAQA